MIPNPGIAIPQKAENNLKLMCFLLRYKERTSREIFSRPALRRRPFVPSRTSRNGKRSMRMLMLPEMNPKDWPRTFEAIEDWLRGVLGVSKIPLAYVIRTR
jgi:hypothetical protein